MTDTTVTLREGPFGLGYIDVYKVEAPKPWTVDEYASGVNKLLALHPERGGPRVADCYWDPAHPEADLDAAKEWLFNLATVAYEGE